MVTPDKLLQELRRIDRRIENLQETKYQIDADFRMVRDQAGWAKRLSVYWLQKDLARQVQYLKMQRRMIHNCYVEAKKAEGRKRLSSEEERDTRPRLAAGRRTSTG